MTKRLTDKQRLKNLIKGALRRLFARSPVVKRVREKAVHPTKKGIRGGKQYTCKQCKHPFPASKIQVDHIKPVIRVNETVHDLDYNTLVSRIFVTEKELQVLCLECHKIKTKKEREQRKNKRN